MLKYTTFKIWGFKKKHNFQKYNKLIYKDYKLHELNTRDYTFTQSTTPEYLGVYRTPLDLTSNLHTTLTRHSTDVIDFKLPVLQTIRSIYMLVIELSVF